MAITISGENNNDRILAQDGVIDQISGINIVGVLTATSFVGDVTGNVTGNLTGNVNSTSPLLLQTGGSEIFRITGNNELGIAGANYGSSGQVLTSGCSGSAVSWATPAITGFTNGSDNRIVTCTSASAITGESSFTYNAGSLIVSNASGNVTQRLDATSGDAKIVLDNSGNGNYSAIDFERERSTGAGVVGGSIFMKSDTSSNDAYLYIQAQSASAQSPTTSALSNDNGVRILLRGGDGILSFETGADERLRITSAGRVGIGTDIPHHLLDVTGNAAIGPIQIAGNPGPNTGIATVRGHFVNAVGDFARLYFSNSQSSGGTVGANAYISGKRDGISGSNWSAGLAFHTDSRDPHSNSPIERMVITSTGKVLIGTSNLINTSPSKFQVASTDATGSAILARFNASVYSSYLDFYKSRSNTLGTAYVVNDDDHLGSLRFYGADGSNS